MQISQWQVQQPALAQPLHPGEATPVPNNLALKPSSGFDVRAPLSGRPLNDMRGNSRSSQWKEQHATKGAALSSGAPAQHWA
jgi:hypothetical protein